MKTAFTAPIPVAPAAAAPTVARKKSKTKWYLLGLLLLVAGAGFAAYMKNKSAASGIPVTTEKALVKTITQLVTATGKVQPEIEVKISPEVAGELIELPFKEGAKVKKGELIVKIRPDLYQAQVDQQEANLVAAKALAVQAKAQLVQAVRDFKRSEDLFAKTLVSESDYTTAKTAVEVAQANYDSLVAQIRRNEGSLNQAQDQLSKTTLYAPMDGDISALESEIGERVVGTGTYAGTEIMRVADLNHMELRVKVNENDIVNVKVGDPAVISIDAYPARKFSGNVTEIGSSAQTTSATSQATAASTDEVTNFLVKIRVNDRDVQLRPGMSATADIETQTVPNVVAVPIQSVASRAEGGKTSEELQKAKARETKEKTGNDLDLATERNDARRERDKLSRVVFIKVGNKVRMQKVETGIADNTHIEVKSGVKPGDEIVSGPYSAISKKLKDGTVVQMEKPKPVDDKK